MTAWIQLAPGSVVGSDFRVGDLLGAGGMGAVYVAEQLSTGRQRALKLMHPGLVAEPAERRRFEREARVGSLIASDHVVEVIGAGVDDPTGIPWIAMELLRGENLAEAVERAGPLRPIELAGWFQQIGSALDAAHAAGVVHRDIKPQNIFLAAIPGTTAGRAIKILDFGIAKVVAATQSTATSMLGSPAWMAPEQTDPRAAITPRTDLWPLGLLAFWWLTGQLFWRAAGAPNASMHAVLREILFDAIPPPTRRAAELGCAERLPAGFDDWFDRSVHREPRARFDSAGELADALAQLCVAGARRAAAARASVPPVPSVPASSAGNVDDAAPTGDYVREAGLSLDADAGLAAPPRPDESASPATSAATSAEPPLPDESASPATSAATSAEPGPPLPRPEAAASDEGTTPLDARAAHPSDRTLRAVAATDPRASARRPRRARAYLGAGLASIGAAAGVALWLAREPRTDLARDVSADPSAAAAAASGVGGHAAGNDASRRAEVARRTRLTNERAGYGRFAEVDPRAFDPLSLLAPARAEAERHLPGARLATLAATGVSPLGVTDLDAGGVVRYELVGPGIEGDPGSPKSGADRERAACVVVLVDRMGARSEPGRCAGPAVGAPRCSLRELLGRVKGFAKGSAAVLFAAGADGHGVWRVTTDQGAESLVDDCERPRLGADEADEKDDRQVASTGAGKRRTKKAPKDEPYDAKSQGVKEGLPNANEAPPAQQSAEVGLPSLGNASSTGNDESPSSVPGTTTAAGAQSPGSGKPQAPATQK